MNNYYDNNYEPLMLPDAPAEEPAMDGEFMIHLMNKLTGTYLQDVPVVSANTMGQLMEAYAEELVINIERRLNFENKRLHITKNSLTDTVGSLSLQAGDVLVVCDDETVA